MKEEFEGKSSKKEAKNAKDKSEAADKKGPAKEKGKGDGSSADVKKAKAAEEE